MKGLDARTGVHAHTIDARLDTPGPFHLEATVRVLQRRPTNPVDTWDDVRYRRALPTPGGLALVEVENRGTIEEPDVRWSLRAGPRSDLGGVLRRVLGLDVDPGPLQRLAESERALRPAAIALRGMRPPRFTGLFETLVNVVPFQQVSLDAGLSVLRRLVDRFGEHVEHEGHRYYAFPEAASVARADVDEVRTCGLSARKAAAIVGLARIVEAGELTEERLAGLPTREALRALDALPGIGPWSASLALLRGFGRLDVFPPGDVGVARGLDRLLDLPEERIAGLIERFGDARGYLYFYSLAGGLLEKGLIHPAPPR